MKTPSVSCALFWMRTRCGHGNASAFVPERHTAVYGKACPGLSFSSGTSGAAEVFEKTEEHYLMLDEDLTVAREIDFCTGCFFVIRPEAFRQMGGFDEGYFMYVEDADLTRKAQSCVKCILRPARMCITHGIAAQIRA